ncbi:exported hypothetical protein [Candidatus Desulfosporosinus infrequens]|uniref:Uncharacterized protein n=1 Tax=Candidatus Desulfosporosinus infrequens TaxID=2043169 RepID=A0A2U3LBL2_9FIRM|nr:exported hypothetical protein [Candidatus Desulfosporosinus infrequens]
MSFHIKRSILVLLLGAFMSLMSVLSIIPIANADTVAPVSIYTDQIGQEIFLNFETAMADPSGNQIQFTVNNGGVSDSVTSVALGNSSNQIVLFLTNPIPNTSTVTLSYSPGSVHVAEGGVLLQAFTAQAVTNSVLTNPSTMVGFDDSALETSYDATNAVLNYRYLNPVDYNKVQLAWYFPNGFFRPMVSDLNSFVKIYEKDTGALVILPNLMTQPNTPETYNGPLTAYDGKQINEQVVTDWYFWQIGGDAPLGLNLVSCTLKPSTTYVVEIDKGFIFNNGNATTTTYNFEFATTAPTSTNGETLTASHPTITGFTVVLSQALANLTASNFKLLDESGNPVTITGVTTPDSGATYMISAALSAGKTYTVTAYDTGYTFGAAQSVIVPAVPGGGSTAPSMITYQDASGNYVSVNYLQALSNSSMKKSLTIALAAVELANLPIFITADNGTVIDYMAAIDKSETYAQALTDSAVNHGTPPTATYQMNADGSVTPA